jgi:hypothetical protein
MMILLAVAKRQSANERLAIMSSQNANSTHLLLLNGWRLCGGIKLAVVFS